MRVSSGGGWDQDKEMAVEFRTTAVRLVIGAPGNGWDEEEAIKRKKERRGSNSRKNEAHLSLTPLEQQ